MWLKINRFYLYLLFVLFFGGFFHSGTRHFIHSDAKDLRHCVNIGTYIYLADISTYILLSGSHDTKHTAMRTIMMYAINGVLYRLWLNLFSRKVHAEVSRILSENLLQIRVPSIILFFSSTKVAETRPCVSI